MYGRGPLSEGAALWKSGFGCVNSACRKRVEARIWEAARDVSARGWAIGFFNRQRDLVAFETSGSGVAIRGALTLLCMVPLPESLGAVELKGYAPQHDGIADALGIAIKVGETCSVAIVFIHPQLDPASRWEASESLQSGAAAVARELAGFAADHDGRTEPFAVPAGPQVFFLLSPSLEVQISWHGDDEASKTLAALARPHSGRLPLFLERAVRRLTASWNFSAIGSCVSGVAYPIKGLSLRVVPMASNGVAAGVFMSSSEVPHVDAVAASFGISSRELQVLHALFDGRSIADIAGELGLAESTVNDHVARVVAKTNSRNRTEMAATLLGWPAMKARAVAGVQYESTDGERTANAMGRSYWRYRVPARR